MLVASHGDCVELLWVALDKGAVRQPANNGGEGQHNVFPVSCALSVVVQHPVQPSLETTAARLTLSAAGCLGEKRLLGARVEVVFIDGLEVGKEEFGLGEAASALQSTSPHEKFSSPSQGLLAPCTVR